jgi:hypothetical protein
MWLCSQIHFSNPMRGFFIPNYHFYQTLLFQGRKGRTAAGIRKGIPNNCRPASACFSEATGDCILISNSEVLIAAVS